jgi:O-6-methylguanine DNA methyltransferase
MIVNTVLTAKRLEKNFKQSTLLAQVNKNFMSEFSVKVNKIVSQIPTGEVMTYKQVAEKAGYPSAARAVANLMAKNFNADIPCHRVIRSDGSVGGYNRGGEIRKKYILSNEGVIL